MTERITKATLKLCRGPKYQTANFDAFLDSALRIGQIVDFEWDGTFIMRGYVARSSKIRGGSPALYHVQCLGINYDLYRDYTGVSDSYSGFTSDIAQDIHDSYTAPTYWDIDIDASSVNISDVSFERKKIGECYDELTSYDGFFFYADYDNVNDIRRLHYIDTPNDSQLSITDDTSFNILKWEIADEKIRNIVTVYGSGDITSYATGDTISIYGPRSFTYKNENIDSQGMADTISSMLISKYETPNENGIIEIDGNASLSLNKKVMIDVTAADYDIDGSFEVAEIKHMFSKKGFKTVLYLEESEWDISDEVSDLEYGRYGY